MKRAIVTGGTGFVGANVARRLLKDGHEVHLLVRRGYHGWRIEDIRDDVRLHEVDLSDAPSLASVVGSIRPEWVFHLAAHGAYSSQTDWRQMVETNIVGTVNMVDACLRAGFETFVNAGTSSEYGFKDHAPSEEEALEPNSAYAVTKASATLYCGCMARSSGEHVVTLRLYSVYGPYEDPKRLVPTLITRGLKGDLPPLVNPDAGHDFVYVDDVCDAFLLAAARPHREPGAIYNVGSGIQTSLREAVAVAKRTLGIAAEPKWGSMPDRVWDTNIWVANCRRAADEMGWRPRHTFEEGFKLTADWLRGNPALLRFYHECRA